MATISTRIAAISLFSALTLACPDGEGPYPGAGDSKADWSLAFAYQGGTLNIPIEAGVWGTAIWIKSFPEYMTLPQSRAILKGPGALYDMQYTDTLPREAFIVPYEDIKDTFYCNGIILTYRPPPDAEVPPEGMDVTFACEVLNPMTDNWERSPDYTRRIVHREKPMDFYIGPSYLEGTTYLYGPDNSFSEKTLTAGELYYRFGFEAKPCPAEGAQMQWSLVGAGGYTGPLGELEIKPDSQLAAYLWICSYTAPEGITSPVDIDAKFSIYDPWAKQRRERVLTFHVVPK